MKTPKHPQTTPALPDSGPKDKNHYLAVVGEMAIKDEVEAEFQNASTTGTSAPPKKTTGASK